MKQLQTASRASLLPSQAGTGAIPDPIRSELPQQWVLACRMDNLKHACTLCLSQWSAAAQP